MTTRRETTLAALLYAVVAILFFLPSFFADRAFVPMHTKQFAPWRDSVDPAELETLARDDYSHASDKLLSFRADDVVTLDGFIDGRVPLWNPNNACGVPHLAQGLYGVLYPPHWVWRVMSPERAYGFLAAFHHFLAAFFTFLFVRRIGARFEGALFAGLAFAFSLCLVGRAHYYQYIESVCWLPLGLLAVEAWLRTRSFRALGLLALVMALILLVGWPQLAAFCGMVFALAALVRAIQVDLRIPAHRLTGIGLAVLALFVALRRAVPDPLWLLAAYPFVCCAWILAIGRQRKAFFATVGGVALALGLGAAIAALQYLPAAEWMRSEGSRSASAPELLAANGMRRWFLLEYLVPGFFGAISDPLTETLQNWQRYFALSIADLQRTGGAAQHYGNGLENAAYVGLGTLLLAPLGLLVRSPRRSFLFALLVIFLGFALGVRAVVYPTYFAGFFVGTDPRRALVIVAFVLACLAGLGLSHAIREPKRAALPLVSIALVLTAFAAFVYPFGAEFAFDRISEHVREIAETFREPFAISPTAREFFQAAASAGFHHLIAIGVPTAIALFVLWRRGHARTIGRLAALAIIALLVVDLLTHSTEARRSLPAAEYLADPPVAAKLRESCGISYRLAHYGTSLNPTEIVLAPNLAGCFGLRDAWCYTVSPPKRIERLADSIFLGWPLEAPSKDKPSIVGSVYLPLLNQAEHLTARALDLFAVKSILGRGEPPSELPPGISLGLRDGATFELRNDDALPRAFMVGTVESIDPTRPLDDIANRVLDPSFDPRNTVLLEQPLSLAPGSGDLARAKLSSDADDRVVIDLEGGEREGVLVLLDTFAPGWLASVDGVDREVLRANCAFRAVAVPAGAKQVVLRYEPRSVARGTSISLRALVLALALLIFGPRRAHPTTA